MPALSPEAMEERRDHIMAAAMKCFAAQGFKGTSMRDICKEADLSVGGVYVHFKAKDDILTALASKFQAERQETYEEVEPNEKEPHKAIGDMLRRLTDYFSEDGFEQELYADIVMMGEAVNIAQLRDVLIETDKQHMKNFEKLAKPLSGDKPFDQETLGQVITGSLFGLLVLKAYHNKLDHNRYVDCVEALLGAAHKVSA